MTTFQLVLLVVIGNVLLLVNAFVLIAMFHAFIRNSVDYYFMRKFEFINKLAEEGGDEKPPGTKVRKITEYMH